MNQDIDSASQADGIGRLPPSPSASTYETAMLLRYREEIEEFVVKPGYAEPGDLEAKIEFVGTSLSIVVTSKSGKDVKAIFEKAFPKPQLKQMNRRELAAQKRKRRRR